MLRKVHRSDQWNLIWVTSWSLFPLVPLLGFLHLYTDNSETFLGDLWISAFLPLFHFLTFSLNVLSALFPFSVDIALSVSSLKIFPLLSKCSLQQPFPLSWALPLLHSNPGLTLQLISLNPPLSLRSCFRCTLVFLLLKLIPSYFLLTCSKRSPKSPIKVKTFYVRSCFNSNESMERLHQLPKI